MSTQNQDNIVDVDFSNTLSERYLAYALSTITARSLPDVRDGLKPVHRRLLYAMLELKLEPGSGFKKCARVVGDVIGKFHPHGDISVYDALVRLAQSFAVRYPLVDGQGNFGSIDGDNAAAMRYTEARLTEVAAALMQDIHNDTVDFRPTYDGSEIEPIVMPSAFPNLLANGSEGIAVGMATSIPPHNVSEICDALLYLLKHKDASTQKLVELVPGPDFPTGGIIAQNQAEIIRAYETGRGAFRVRAKWEVEELKHGMYQVVITEIPYQVQKSRLIEKIAELFKEKKLPMLGNIRDESAEDIRIVLDPKNRSVEASVLMEALYRCTDLEIKFNLNMNVLNGNGIPKVMSLKEVLEEFLAHRHVVLVRRLNYRLGKIEERLVLLDGFLIAYINLDEVIRIIREEDEPKQVMMKKWKLLDVQAEAILNMRLRSLRKLEETEIKTEHNKLSKEKKGIKDQLKDENLRTEVIAEEIKEIKKKFAKTTVLGKRRTVFSDAPSTEVINIESFITKEPVTIISSKLGWIKALKGHVQDLGTIKYKDGDDKNYVIYGQTTDKLLVFTSDGKFYTLNCNDLTGGKGFGEPLNHLLDLAPNSQVITLLIYNEQEKMLLANKAGKGFIVEAKELLAQTKNGKQIFNAGDTMDACICKPVTGNHIAIIGENRRLSIYNINEIPTMKRGTGVTLQKHKHGGISDIKIFNLEEGLRFKLGSKTITETKLTPWLGKRPHPGRLPPTGFPRNNKFN